MEKVKIHFMMKVSDGEKTEFISIGKNEKNVLRFKDNEKNENIIIFDNGIIKYTKYGDILMDFVFNPDVMTDASYENTGLKFKFKVKTNQLIFTNGHIVVDYDIYDDLQFLSSHCLEIIYESL